MTQPVTATPFGEQVRRYRRQAGMTQEALAEAAQLSVRAISNIERGVKHVPRRETVDLLADALRVSDSDKAAFAAAARQLHNTVPLFDVPSNLPPEANSFIGRLREVEEVSGLVQRFPLVTLVGMGGTGKTRLAIAVARRQLETFHEGVFFVALAPLTRPDLVLPSIADALGLVEWREATLARQLEGFLHGKDLLLVLDNFEHVVEAAPHVAELAANNPGVHLLTTSRSRLQVYGEQEFPVPPLELPASPDLASVAESEAVRLFNERARNVQPAFAVTRANAADVASICARLDGLPLAIELAAARTRLFTPGALLARLDRSLTLLSGGHRNQPERLQSMRGAIDWSYQLLDEEEQRLFAYLSVFASGCTLDAAEAVGADGQLDVIAGIGSLVEKSLLRREGDDEPRFLMAEPVREYATERFAKDEHANVVRRRHADYYSSLAAQGSTELSGPRHLEWSQRLAEEHDNLRAVLDWYRTRGEEEGLKLAVSLTRFWELRGHLVEGRRWLEVFLAGTQSIPLQAAALCAIGTLARTQGDYDSSVRSLETALKLVREHGDERAIASVLHTFGRVVWGNPERALALLQESRATVRATGDKRLLARALINEGLQLSWSGLSARAKVLAEESLALYQELGDDQGAAVALLILSGAAHWEGDYDGARGLSDESEALLRRVGLGVDFLEATQLMALQTRDQGNYRQAELVLDTALAMCDAGGYRPLRATMRRLSGLMARERGEYERATQLYEESLAEYRDLQDRENRDMAIVGLSDIARDLGDVEGVVDWCSTLLPRAKDASHTYPRGWALNNLGIVAGQQGAFERAHELFSQALAMGRNLTESYRAEVLSAVGWLLLQEAQYRRALATLSESLRLSQTVGPVFLFATVLEGTASAAAGDGLLEHAAILFGAAEAMRDRIGAPIWPSRRALYDRYRAVARDGLGEERFHEGHQTGQSLSERDAIAYALRHFPAQVEPVTVAGEV